VATDPSSDLSAGTTDEALGVRVGALIRSRRSELGKKLSEIAASTDLSVSYLSSIEKGIKVPSLPVLARIAHGLDTTLAEMLRASASPRINHGSLTDNPGAEQLNIEGSPLRIARLSSQPGEHGTAPVAFGGSDVFVFLHHGQLKITVDNTIYELDDGDALHSDRPLTMTWTSGGKETTTSVWAATPQQNIRRSGGG
jgi:transcriptional regulator with XRE-family HTH domain